MDIQGFIDSHSAAMGDMRSLYHITLGGLITTLETIEDKSKVVVVDGRGTSITRPHSYRGYYVDLAFEVGGLKTVAEVLSELKDSVLGKHFTGYKGGEFIMNEKTPLWISNWGCSSQEAVIDIVVASEVILKTKIIG